MEKNPPGFALKETVEKKEEPEAWDLRETLCKVDRILEAFYEIHGPRIDDQGGNL